MLKNNYFVQRKLNALYVERSLLHTFQQCIQQQWDCEMLGNFFRKPQFFFLEISKPKVVENFRCTGRSGLLLGPGPEASASPTSWIIRPCTDGSMDCCIVTTFRSQSCRPRHANNRPIS